MVDIQNINGYGIEDPGFALLREGRPKNDTEPKS